MAVDFKNFLIPLRSFGSYFFGGKDQYTQTYFPNAYHQQFMLKGEQWLEMDDDQKFKIYNTTPHLKAIIDRKALMKANGKWKHFRWVSKDGEMIKEEVENSPYINKLNNPNFLQNGTEFFIQSSILQSVYGNNIIYAPKVLRDVPAVLWNLPTPYISIDRTGKLFKQVDITGVIEKYKFNNPFNGDNEEYDPTQILHLRDPNPIDPVVGLSKLEGLMMAISNLRASLGFRNRIITSNAMLGILSSDAGASGQMGNTPLNNKQQKLLSEGLGSAFGMQDGKADILQTEASVKWQAMSYPTKDLMLFEEVDDDFKVMIDAFGLNVNIFSISSQSTYENLKNGIVLAYEDTIIPEGKAEGLEWSQYFGLNPDVEWIERCYDHLSILEKDDSASLQTRANAISILLKSGIPADKVSEIVGIDLGDILDSPLNELSPLVATKVLESLTDNEKRELGEYPPIDGGDELPNKQNSGPDPLVSVQG